MKTKFIFQDNFKQAADKLPNELRLKFYDAITDYAFKGIEPDDVVVAALLATIKPDLDKKEKRGGNHNPSGQNQYKEVKEGQNRSNEVKTGQTRSNNSSLSSIEVKVDQNDLQKERKEPKESKNIYNNPENNKLFSSPSFDNQTDIEDFIKPRKKFQKPTIDEVNSYCLEKGYTINGQTFIDFYESKGWKVGKNPMTNWRAALSGWVSREKTLRAAKDLIPHKTGVASGTYGKDIPL